MTQQTDVSRSIELWLLDDEPDVLPERVLKAVSGLLPSVHQRTSQFGLFATWRQAAVAASLAVVAAASLGIYGALQPRPPLPVTSLSPSPSMTPSATPMLTPFPSYSIPPVESVDGIDNEPINGRVRASGLGKTTSLDLRGWRNPPGFMYFAIKSALIDTEGGSFGLLGLIQPRQKIPGAVTPALTATLRGGGDISSPRATIRVSFLEAPSNGLTALAQRVAAEAYDGTGSVADVLELPVGPAALVRTAATVEHSGFFEIAIYLVDLGDATMQITFGAPDVDANGLPSEFLRVVRSIRVLDS